MKLTYGIATICFGALMLLPSQAATPEASKPATKDTHAAASKTVTPTAPAKKTEAADTKSKKAKGTVPVTTKAMLMRPAVPVRPAYHSLPGQQSMGTAAPSIHDSSKMLSVTAGSSIVIDTPRPIKRIAVGLGDFAEANAITPTQVLVNGKVPGETSLILWDVTGAREFIHLTVQPDASASNDHLDSVRRELRAELPDSVLQVSTANGSVFLRGTVKDLNSSDRAVQIAGTAGKVVNLLYVQVPPSAPQVLLKVRFASVDRSAGRQLGANLFSTGLGNTIAGVNTGQFSPPSLSTPSGTTGSQATLSNELNLFAFFPGLNVGATIEAMESKGLVEVLAEPNLMAESGKKASFLAGGEYPFPVVQGTSSGSAAVTISFKEYGVRLSFIPTVTPRGTVEMQLLSEVSSLDFSNAVTISGFQVPAIATRNVKTDVELGEGQSFAIGGLLDNRETQTMQKIPFLSSIPILGKFFQSVSKTKNNSELIVIVTPTIVQPIPAGSPLPQLKYPEKFMPSNSGIPMHTPDTAPNPHAPPPPTMPVEKLLESMKPEKQLMDDAGGSPGSFGAGSTGASTSAPK